MKQLALILSFYFSISSLSPGWADTTTDRYDEVRDYIKEESMPLNENNVSIDSYVDNYQSQMMDGQVYAREETAFEKEFSFEPVAQDTTAPSINRKTLTKPVKPYAYTPQYQRRSSN